MVIWIFAGGGESEVRGLTQFLGQHYTHNFERKSPIRLKPGPRPSTQPGYGLTGNSLADQIKKILRNSVTNSETCDFILVIDDLDCHNLDECRQTLRDAVDSVPNMAATPSYVGFAVPEIESWIIADWGRTLASDHDFRNCHEAMRHRLSTYWQVPFSEPENFSEFDAEKDTCADKLSDALIETSKACSSRNPYSKAIHTPRFLRKLTPDAVSEKCPAFREIHMRLSRLNSEGNSRDN